MENPPPGVHVDSPAQASPAPAEPPVAPVVSQTVPSAGAIVAELATLPHVAVLAAAVRSAALEAAEARASFGSGGARLELERSQAETPFGNVLDLLEHGVTRSSGGGVLGALVAIGIGNAPSELGRTELGKRLVWLAAHTPVDPLSALDAALGDHAETLWRDVAAVAVDPQAERAEALTAAAALSASRSESSRRVAAGTVSPDALIRALLEREAGGAELSGELAPPPRSALVTALLALTGILLLVHLVRLIGRYALAYRHPARLKLGERGLELSQRIELLGRLLRDRESLVPLDNLARVTREVRYPRVGMYAGLLALVLGSYLGLGLLVDGVRVPGGSPPLLGLGVLVIVLGIAIDFALTSLSDSVRGRCRLVIEPRKGRRLCVGGLDPASADRMLNALAEKTRR